MSTPQSVLPQHEIQHKDSCIAWAWEFHLKIHDKIRVDEYPLQNGAFGIAYNGWGFGARERNIIHSQYGLTTLEDAYTAAELAIHGENDAKAGKPLVFTLPNSAAFHSNVAMWTGAETKYFFRIFQKSGIYEADVSNEYAAILRQHPTYKIHCLRVV